MSEALQGLRTICFVIGCALVLAATGNNAHAYEARSTPNNTMLVKLDAGNSHMTERVVLALDKAMIVQLPVGARDVLVSNPKIADAVIRTPRRIYLMGLSIGQANAFFFDEAGKQILNLEISVERDLTTLNEIYTRFLPGSAIEIESVNDNIVLTGRVKSPAQAAQARDLAARYVADPDKVLSMLAVESSEQVLLKVRIAEMQRTFAKQLGVDLDGTFSIGDVTGTLTSQNPFSLLGRTLSDAEIGGSYTDPSDGDTINGSIKALERAGLIKTLAEPNLTAISGESANFLAGGEFPVPVKQDADGDVSLEFKPFGVGLGFTPVVLSSGRISLKISTEVSETTAENSFVTNSGRFIDPDTNAIVTIPGLTIPGLTVRRAETTVELPSGGSLVMAGLLQDDVRQNIDGLPGAKDVPVLGSLFKSRDFQNRETELVVLVTPYLVKPTHERNIRLPTDGYAPASDLDTVLLGRLGGVYGSGPLAGKSTSIKGPIGFVMN